jgi:Ca2+-binding RTX toxin-like protein
LGIGRKNPAVKDNKKGTANPPQNSSPDNPQDYSLFLLNDIWQETSNGWYATIDAKFIDGKSVWIPLQISENALAESNQNIIWDITGSDYGFSTNTITFSESDDIVFVEVSPKDSYKTVKLNIKDNDIDINKTPPITGNDANNNLSGTDASEEIYGRGGNDTINGGKGNDKLFGGYTYRDLSDDGNDNLNGGEGDDILDGGSGSDTMAGGLGNDTYFVDNSADKVIENPNSGIDTVKSSVTFTLSGTADRVDNLTLVGGGNDINGTGNALNNKIIGNNGNNKLWGLDGNDTLLGEGGNDTLDGGNGDDSLYGGFGKFSSDNDSLLGGSGKDYLNGGSGNDTLEGGSGNDTLDGWNGDDTLNGGADSDTLAGDFGNDQLFGEDGNDILYGEDGNDSLNGGAGNDTLNGGAGNDTLDGMVGKDALIGGLGNDQLVGGDGDDSLNGYGTTVTNDSQFDTLLGGAGSDTFVLGGTWGVSYVETDNGYGIIADWNALSDKIQVKGSSSQYRLKTENKVGTSALDMSIYYIGGGGEELIGVVQDTTNVSLSRFTFV